MRVAVIGATGTIGREIVQQLIERHDVIEVTRKEGPHRVDISDAESVRAFYRALGRVDAVVCAAGSGRSPVLTELSDEDLLFSLHNKLGGQVNLVRLGLDALNDGGSFTITSGVLSLKPLPGSDTIIGLVNAGLQAFTRAAARELPRGLRINSVSPGWVAETLTAMGRDPAGGVPSAKVAQAYIESVEGTQTGAILSV